MNLSYWEIKSWFTDIDYTIVGSGIVGLSCALQLKRRYPKSKILVLEKGILPQGASTKNAGFACFGSLSEIIEDLDNHSENEVLDLIKKRINGLQLLRDSLGDKTINYKHYGGYELFLKSDKALYNRCLDKRNAINDLLKPIFKKEVFLLKENTFNFNNIQSQYCFNQYEGQLDTGKMMQALIEKAHRQGIKILNNCKLNRFEQATNSVNLEINDFEFATKHLFIATNGFASQSLNLSVKPARAQVLITKPVNNLKINGTFHLDKGYYYFRNINNRILLGGGRNLDFKGEETTQFGETLNIQNKLEELLANTILPHTKFEIEHRWSGIMGVGNQKKAIVKPLSNNVFCGIRLGGMGVAIGSLVGKELAELVQ
ncbi:MAG: FAD-binding oxidoreductase [Winogradskyella sp.]|uniref:NAD(P)/FAD-dependent oxidoreductase n=1 Tax=Winogradskyella sp. TaxID=1883156 RepID=UPI00181E9DF2|nr:FAD-binding oxidoreductase [Winogradskyella sp.]